MGETHRSVGAAKAETPRRAETPWIVLGIIVFSAATLWVGTKGAAYLNAPLRWLAIAGLMAAFLMFVGHRINRRLDGVLIDSRFKISLSRLQIALWTVLVLSAYLVIALPRSMPGGLFDLDNLDPATRAALKKLSPDRADCLLEEGEPLNPELCVSDPLRISIPSELLIAMGISTASFAGSILVKSTKREKKVEIHAIKQVRDKQAELNLAKTAQEEANRAYKASEEELTKWIVTVNTIRGKLGSAQSEEERQGLEIDLRTAEAAHQEAASAFVAAKTSQQSAQETYERLQKELETVIQTAEQEQEGVLHRNSDPSQARWEDLFRGEEIGNYRLIDMSKIQMFFFTLVLVFSYAAAVYGLIQNTIAIKNPLGIDLPLFTAGMNSLLAISHAGYLTVKTVDHTPVEK